MGKKGGSSQPQSAYTQSSVTQTNLPEYARPYYERLMERTEAESNQPYVTYPDARLAGFSDTQNQAIEGVKNLQPANLDPSKGMISGFDYNSGYQFGGDAYNPIFDTGSVQTGDPQFQSGIWNPIAASGYMNPYIGNVLSDQVGRMNQQFDRDQAARNAKAVQAGAFGGSRQGIAEEVAREAKNRGVSEIINKGLSDAYTTGAEIFQSDANRRLQAAGMTQQAQQQQEALRQGIGALNLQGATGLASIEQLGKGLDLQDLQAMLNVGGMERDLEQAGLDVGYSDFINQRDAERQNLAFLSGILRGIPVSPQSEVTMYTAQPNSSANLLGAGIAGLGLAKEALS